MTIKEFRDKFIKIEYLKELKEYGHREYHLHVENEGHGDLDAVIPEMNTNLIYGPIGITHICLPEAKIYFSLDFEAQDDIKNDFVAVFSVIDGDFSIFAIPYNTETGEIYPDIHMEDSNLLNVILSDFKHFCDK